MYTQDINMKKRPLKTNASDVIKIPNAMPHQIKVLGDEEQNEVKAPLSKVSGMPKKAGLYSAAEKITMGTGKLLYKTNKKNIAIPAMAGLGALGAKAEGGSALEGGLRGAASQVQILPGVTYQNLSGNIKAKTQSEQTEDQKRRGLIYNKLQHGSSNTNNIPTIGG